MSARAEMADIRAAVRLRPVTAADAATLYAWACDPLTRAMSFSSATPTRAEHDDQLAERLANPFCLFWLALDAEQNPVGCVRLDGVGSIAVISITVAPEQRGRGVATAMIAAACKRAADEHAVRAVRALIKPENKASRRAFEKAGFVETGRVFERGCEAIEAWIRLRGASPR